mgnify:FL=1
MYTDGNEMLKQMQEQYKARGVQVAKWSFGLWLFGVLLSLFGVLLSLGMTGGVIWIAVHFLRKYW